MQYYPYNISFNVNKAIKISEVRNYSSSEVRICFLVVWCFLCLADAIPQGEKKNQKKPHNQETKPSNYSLQLTPLWFLTF